MAAQATQKQMVPRIPFPWAVVGTLVISLIPTLFLGKWNFTTWVSFIVWAEYFTLGGNFATWKLIIPSIPFGAFSAAGWFVFVVFLQNMFGASNFQTFLWMSITSILWVGGLVYLIPKWENWEKGTLACFNGLTLWLAVYFTGSYPQFGPMDNPYWVILWAFVWTVAMAYFGWLLGVINTWLLFPKEVDVPVQG